MNTAKLNTMVALAIFVVMLFIYLLTVAPAISFWDSPEFITCASIMGIPHPPGSPILSLLGRVMTLIPLYDFRGGGFESIAYRVNLLAVLAGALTVMLTYLITVKLITRMVLTKRKFESDGLIMFSAAVSAFMAGFSHQFWENSIEIETYMPSLLISLLAVWLTLKWEEKKDNPQNLRYLFLAVYCIGLGMGIHLYVLLIAPAVFLIVVAAKPAWFSNVRLWVNLIPIIIVLGLIKYFGGRALFMIAMVSFSIFGPLFFTRIFLKETQLWKKTLWGVLLCLALFFIGYSVYPTILIRAAKEPAVNEGNPDNWNRYNEYLNRTQYGQGNMYTGMFYRKASFNYQFNYMYLRYLFRQFPKWGPSPKITFKNDKSPGDSGGQDLIQQYAYLPVLLILILFFGIYYHVRNDGRHFGIFFLYFLISSIGLVLYLNMENPQVRERGYFFLGSFQIIMVWIGIGIYGFISSVRNRLSTRLLTPVTVLMFAVFATLIPVAALSNHIDPDYTNYQVHDRSQNWVSLDFAINMLQSCEKNAILFTHGDNDTYPLWYAQHVNGIRKDVNVVNLSILNAPWYIKQLRDEDNTIPIAFSDDYIDNKLCSNSLASYRTLLWTPEPKEITVEGLTWEMPPTYVISNGETGILSVSSFVVAHIIEKVNWMRPIYFSTYIEQSKMIGLEKYMSMEGMVYRLTREKSITRDYNVNVQILGHNILNRYRYRGITDPDVYKSPETVKLLQNYFIAFVELCDVYLNTGNRENALQAARRAYDFSMRDSVRLKLLENILRKKGLDDEINNIFIKKQNE